MKKAFQKVKRSISARYWETAKYGININTVAPGPIDIGLLSPDSEMYQQVITTIPIGRMGLPIDIANLAVFLASDELSFITGQCIVCDDGSTIL